MRFSFNLIFIRDNKGIAESFSLSLVLGGCGSCSVPNVELLARIAHHFTVGLGGSSVGALI